MGKTLPYFILACIAGTLVNSDYFGDPTLAPFFLFTSLAGITTIITLSGYIFLGKRSASGMPLYIKIFLLLVLYVFFHGLLNKNIGLTHYFWLSCGLFMCTIHFVASQYPATNKPVFHNQLAVFLFCGIAVLALAECLIVLSQLTGQLRTLNGSFKATGSWVNPNVTAMALAASLPAIIWLGKNIHQKGWKLLAIAICILTIAVVGILKCRSAYIFTSIVLVAEAIPLFKEVYQKRRKLTPGLAMIILLAIGLTAASLAVFMEKKTSAFNRIGIWSTSLNLIAQKPLQGHGFGTFEREYNLFAAEKKNPVNDHINMPYNDFLELGIEGGLPAMLLWAAFLVSTFRFYYTRKEKHFVFPLLVGFITIQLSNFLFQALPVMALLITYLAISPHVSNRITEKPTFRETVGVKKNISFKGALILAALALMVITVNVAYGFYQTAQIKQKSQGMASIQAYKRIEKYAKGHPFYHASLGEAYLQANDITNAKQQYLLALQHTSEENVLDNCGYCYQLTNRYDSSEYYYTILRDMTPHKFGPRFRLLKLFEQTGDTARMLQTAKAIDSMPIKVGGQEVDYIKRYARLVLQLKNKSD